jgi:hypothetical protein
MEAWSSALSFCGTEGSFELSSDFRNFRRVSNLDANDADEFAATEESRYERVAINFCKFCFCFFYALDEVELCFIGKIENVVCDSDSDD